MSSEHTADLEALSVLRGDAPPIDDPDPRSQSERTVNRMWAALRRAGDRELRGAEEDVRLQLDSVWPELRLEAMTTLCAWGDPKGILLARGLARDPLANATERSVALDALRLSPEATNPEIINIVASLSMSESKPIALAVRKWNLDAR